VESAGLVIVTFHTKQRLLDGFGITARDHDLMDAGNILQESVDLLEFHLCPVRAVPPHFGRRIFK